jgi:hypothetical protein
MPGRFFAGAFRRCPTMSAAARRSRATRAYSVSRNRPVFLIGIRLHFLVSSEYSQFLYFYAILYHSSNSTAKISMMCNQDNEYISNAS